MKFGSTVQTYLHNISRTARDPISIGSLIVILAFFLMYFLQPQIIDTFSSRTITYSRISAGDIKSNNPVFKIGPIYTPTDDSSFLIHLKFKALDSHEYQNLFQTDEVNSGLRVELHGKIVAMLIALPGKSNLARAVILSDDFKKDVWHDLEIHIFSKIEGRAFLDGKTVTLPPAGQFGTADVRFGDGFNTSRRFRGEIEDASIAYGSAQAVTRLAQILHVNMNVIVPASVAAFCIFLLRQIVLYPPVILYHLALTDRRMALRAFAGLKDGIVPFQLQLAYFSILFVGVGIVYNLLWHHLQHRYIELTSDLLPGFGFTKGIAHFKSEVFLLALLELSFAATLAALWATQLAGIRQLRVYKPLIIFPACAVGAMGLISISPSLISRVALYLAFALFLFQTLVSIQPMRPLLPRSLFVQVSSRFFQAARVLANQEAVKKSAPLESLFARAAGRQIIIYSTILIVVGLAAWPACSVWFPVVIPNDYVEISDSFSILGSSSPSTVSRQTLARCLEKIESESSATDIKLDDRCAWAKALSLDQRADLQYALLETSSWQGEPGRILFHHSYIFDPAKHFLTYGLDRAVPYLYGYGNTIFHAILMELDGGPTLTAYFNTFPVAEMFGIAAVAGLVLFITRSPWALLASASLSLIAFYGITFTTVLLAASFSPLRFLGLAVQIGAMTICCRATSQRWLLLLPLSALVSLFWNTEFAELGVVGQGLLMFAPRLPIKLAYRLALMSLLIATTAAWLILTRPAHHIISTVDLSFFNVWVPAMDASHVLIFFVSLAIAHIIGVGLTLQFSGRERILRLAFIPIVALVFVKYAVNPSPPHFLLACTFAWPMGLTFIRWDADHAEAFHLSNARQWVLPILAILLLLKAAFAGWDYVDQSKAFRRYDVEPIAATSWSAFGETISFRAPEDPLVRRVTDIKRYLKPDDRLLLLSPFDHILMFYVNPKQICGHFELMTNLATKDIVNGLVQCAEQSHNVLIAYDKASEVPCPTGPLQTGSRCTFKAAMKRNLVAVRDAIMPMVDNVGSTEDMMFYRVPEKKAQK